MKKNIKKMLLGTMATSIGIAPIAVAVACGSDDDLDPGKKDSAVMMVGASGHKDKGFLQGAYEGIQTSIKKKIGLSKYREIKIAGAEIPQAKEGTKNALIAGGYVIVGVGYQYPTFFNTDDYAGKYKDRFFVGIDGVVNDESYAPLKSLKPNVLAVAFDAEKSSFLAGISASLYLAKNYETYKTNGGLKIGAFGGSPYAPIKDMLGGFMQGIAFYNDNLAMDEDHKIEFIGWNQAKGGFSGGFTPGPKSVSMSKQLLSKDADIIFPVAGGQVSSVVDAINNTPNSQTKIIGVDSDQTKVFGAEDGQLFITSSMKDTGAVAIDSINAIYKKTSKIELGKNNFVGLDGGFVKIAPGLINGAEFGGKHFSSILKEGQTLLAVENDAPTIYAQLSDVSNAIYEAAKRTQKSSLSWDNAKRIFEGTNKKIVLNDVTSSS